MDYRRPVSSANVIDLTDEDAGPSAAPHGGQREYGRPPRPPRFGRDIMRDVIDLDAEDSRRTAAAPSSPEIEIISSRRLDPPRRNELPGFGRYSVDADDVEFVSENPLPDAFRRSQSSLHAMHALLSDMSRTAPVPRLQEQVRRAERQRLATMNRVMANIARRDPTVPPRARRGHIHVGFMQPNFDYGAAAFDLGLHADMEDEPPARPPTYEAPVKAPEGFTRSPQEEDDLLCPNCGDELCCGESELKKQVWIVKHCGHVR